MYGKLKISHNRHTSRLLPHEFTSYIPLALLALFVGVFLVGFSMSALNAADPPPQAGSIGLSGTMPEPPPATAATISVPAQGQHFTTTPITISGSCQAGLTIEIYKNNIFAGSTICKKDGTYSLQVDLLFGQNTLTAQVFDLLNQAGPVSNSVTVFDDSLQVQASAANFLNFAGSQLLLHSDAVYRGVFPQQMLTMPLTVLGGTPPYAVNVEWGDSKNSVVSLASSAVFNVQHAYDNPGTYSITFQASDSHQQVAFLTVAAIVNGQPATSSTPPGRTSPTLVSMLLLLWPLYAICATMIISFWLGERREKRIMLHAQALAQNPLVGANMPPHTV